MGNRVLDRMPDIVFRLMEGIIFVKDGLFPVVDKRCEAFPISLGMTIVDYGCGPGRYTRRFSAMVGPTGRVYAVDVHELALAAVERQKAAGRLANVETVLADGYSAAVPSDAADLVCALDMFFLVSDRAAFLEEAWRIAKPSGRLLVDDGHRPRTSTLRRLSASALWSIAEENEDFILCVPAEGTRDAVRRA